MGAWRNNGNDIAVGRGNRVRTFYILSFSGSGRYCQDQILICDLIYLFVYFLLGGYSLLVIPDNSISSVFLAWRGWRIMGLRCSGWKVTFREKPVLSEEWAGWQGGGWRVRQPCYTCSVETQTISVQRCLLNPVLVWKIMMFHSHPTALLPELCLLLGSLGMPHAGLPSFGPRWCCSCSC